MDIDVFTLFPSWFDWFRGQRHVANVLATGTSIDNASSRSLRFNAETPRRFIMATCFS